LPSILTAVPAFEKRQLTAETFFCTASLPSGARQTEPQSAS
jgi:hypothetical protein